MSISGTISFESHAKLMITGEYLVLKGARSLAIPLRFGQKLVIDEKEGTSCVKWKSMINTDLWFSATLLLPDFRIANASHPDLTETLRKIFVAAQALNPKFLESKHNYQVTSVMNFDPQWGIGSSSSLISNIAYWADCDPFDLNYQIFNGSGYDIACARSSTPVIYELQGNQPLYHETNFYPKFHKHLYFVYLNQKQNSKESLRKTDLSRINANDICDISDLTLGIAKANDLETFQSLIDYHEDIIANIIRQQPVKSQLFNDFNGSVKSLGAWGGDFILVASAASEIYVYNYFNNKGLNTIFRFDEMILAG